MERACSGCGYSGPDWQFEEHHPDRLAQPKLTVTLCIPCHREETRREREALYPNPKVARFELRCRKDELERWRAAAGAVPLSRWLRLAADAFAESRVLPLESQAVMGDRVFDMRSGEQIGVLPARGFRPDFKGGSR